MRPQILVFLSPIGVFAFLIFLATQAPAAEVGGFFVNPGGAGSSSGATFGESLGDSHPLVGKAKNRKSKEVKTDEAEDLRTFAEGQLSNQALKSRTEKATKGKTPSSQTVKNPTPSVMLPLQENYQPLAPRTWAWRLGVGFTQKTYHLERVGKVIGPTNSSQYGQLPFLELDGGFERSLDSWVIGAAVLGTYSQSRQDLALGAMTVPATARAFGMGLEPFVRYLPETADWQNWQPEIGLSMNQMTFTQTSKESELLEWTQGFHEYVARATLSYAFDSQSRLAVSVKRAQTEIEGLTSLSLGGFYRW